MVGLETIRASNAALKKLHDGLVAVFVGGTSGIGEYTLKAFVEHTTKPRVYLVGRSEEAAQRIAAESEKLNAESAVHFIRTDCSLLSNVDVACREIQAQEPKINLLFMTPGFLSMKGRQETTEGLDKKLCLNYYARMRFATNLLPQLTAAASPSSSSSSASTPPLSRIVSVLSPGREAAPIADDLGLRRHYSLRNAEAHAITMSDLFLEELARRHPRTGCVHSYPGGVRSGIVSRMGGPVALVEPVLYALLGFLLVPEAESGARHLYAATAGAFAPREGAGGGEGEVAVGSDGERGSGCYLVNQRTERTGKEAVLRKARAEGMREKVWEHTMEEFARIEGAAGASS